MASIIHKHRIPHYYSEQATYTLEMAEGAEILSVAVHHDSICLWEKHNEVIAVRETRNFFVVGTGVPFSKFDDHKYTFLGTVVKDSFVWHIYEIKAGGRY